MTKVVIHWTGGIREPEGVYQTLRARNLSVHFVIGSNGALYQFTPLDLVCLHAGGVNEESIGIEVCSPGIAGTPIHEAEYSRGVMRQRYEDRIHRRDRKMLDFTPAQYATLLLLCEELADKLSIPRMVPLEKDGSLMRRQMTKAEIATYSGFLGHYHAHATKLDPGTRPLDALRQRWIR